MSAFMSRNARMSCLSQKFYQNNNILDAILLPKITIAAPYLQISSRRGSRPIPQTRHYATSPAKRNSPMEIKKSHEENTINAPLSTLPAFVETPTRKPGQGTFSYVYTVGKTYIGFYKTGLVNVKNNFYAARPIKERVAQHPTGTVLGAASSGAITRSEWQLLLRNQHDMARVPVFALVVLICGEFTPLIVIALSNIVPWTCRIPKQILMDRKKLEERRSISFRNLTLPAPKEAGVEQLHRMQALHINWSLGLSSRLWDWLGGQLPGLPTGMLKKKVAKRIEYLKVDDKLISSHGGVKELSAEEVKMACVERGLDILDRSEKDIRHDLNAWIESTQKAPYEVLMLTRPSQWPVKGLARPPKQSGNGL